MVVKGFIACVKLYSINQSINHSNVIAILVGSDRGSVLISERLFEIHLVPKANMYNWAARVVILSKYESPDLPLHKKNIILPKIPNKCSFIELWFVEQIYSSSQSIRSFTSVEGGMNINGAFKSDLQNLTQSLSAVAVSGYTLWVSVAILPSCQYTDLTSRYFMRAIELYVIDTNNVLLGQQCTCKCEFYQEATVRSWKKARNRLSLLWIYTQDNSLMSSNRGHHHKNTTTVSSTTCVIRRS